MLDKRNLRVSAIDQKRESQPVRVSDQELFQQMGVEVGRA